jgi:PAS domain S-box-containing protein
VKNFVKNRCSSKDCTLEEELSLLKEDLNNTYSLFEESGIVLFRLINDSKWSVKSVTKNVKDIFGYDEDDFYTNKVTFSDTILPQYLEKVKDEYRNALSNGVNTYLHEPYIMLTKDLKQRYVQNTTSIIKNKDGVVTHLLGFIIDITEHIEEKNELLNLQNRFSLALDSSRDGLWDWDIKTGEVFFSTRWKSMLGYSDSDIKNCVNSWDELLHPDDKLQAWSDIQKHLNKETEYYENEQRLKCKDGTYKWILDRGKVRFDNNGNPCRMIGFHTDISRQKDLEESLKELNKTLEEKVQKQIKKIRKNELILFQQSKLASMGEMIGSIAHQWRQPLNSLAIKKERIMVDFEDGDLDESAMKKYSNEVDITLEYMSNTIDDFRKFFNPSRDKMPFSIFSAIDSISLIFSAQLENHDIKLNINKNENIYDIRVFGYENEFKQVIINIINNAKDAILINNIKKAQINLDIYTKDKKVFIDISDNGGGIPKDVIFRIFEPYFTTKFESQGTGIGLYMSKTIIEKNMSGSLLVRNIKNGTCFTVVLDLLACE